MSSQKVVYYRNGQVILKAYHNIIPKVGELVHIGTYSEYRVVEIKHFIYQDTIEVYIDQC